MKKIMRFYLATAAISMAVSLSEGYAASNGADASTPDLGIAYNPRRRPRLDAFRPRGAAEGIAGAPGPTQCSGFCQRVVTP